MKTSDFDYRLPEEMIAYRPVAERHNSRLMVLDREHGGINHKRFFELPDLLNAGDLLVLNNTRVLPARLFGNRKSGREIEVLLLEKQDGRRWTCLVRNPKENLEIKFGSDVNATLHRNGRSEWIIEFNEKSPLFLDRIGKMPLPPYIKRAPDESDRSSYQTVFAEKEGAIAAPTAGLHFTPELLGRLKRKGVEIRYVTLHVGIGTFKPVQAENIEEHEMHAEQREIPIETAAAVNRARADGRRVIAVGTTVVRTLESSVDEEGSVEPLKGRTDLYIRPGFKFKAVNGLITNFHLPRSTLLMLVSAFAGREFIFKAYDSAMSSGYRFLSYGDAMFII
ncbi:MAG: tRNA preQ1(34) S-adenosylmethionine ribosyltransferase-isomerase QueA [Deltaproteobacteria bacterium]